MGQYTARHSLEASLRGASECLPHLAQGTYHRVLVEGQGTIE